MLEDEGLKAGVLLHEIFALVAEAALRGFECLRNGLVRGLARLAPELCAFLMHGLEHGAKLTACPVQTFEKVRFHDYTLVEHGQKPLRGLLPCVQGLGAGRNHGRKCLRLLSPANHICSFFFEHTRKKEGEQGNVVCHPQLGGR